MPRRNTNVKPRPLRIDAKDKRRKRIMAANTHNRPAHAFPRNPYR